MVVPLTAGKHLHESVKNAELVTISETSHQAFEEKAGEVAKEIIEFISRFMN
jgi:pimeloyl-ACP methyl ester carboxylesterase